MGQGGEGEGGEDEEGVGGLLVDHGVLDSLPVLFHGNK